jgi:molybdopterin-guanine dinucleotide biosynthesis protein A
MRVSGVIQAGGKSVRMGGQPKALMQVGGRRIVERVVDVLTPLVDDVLLVTNTPDMYAFLGLPMVGDLYPDAGALGGLYTGVASARGDVAFTVACDMPFLHRDVARLVIERAGEADVVVPRVGHQLETLHAAYGKACLPHMEARIRAGRLKIVGFFESVQVLEIAEAEVARHADPAVAFMNVNTPDELVRARTLATSRG